MKAPAKKFGLITSIAMIVGIVIGSGIFFKTDDILIKTGGNVLLGCLAWLLGAMGIVFGGLSISSLAARSDEAGGIITYMEMVSTKRAGFLTGWFLSIIYYPALIAIICYVAGLYTMLLFGQAVNTPLHWIVTAGYLLFFTILNACAVKLAGIFQSSTMFIKLIPLFFVAIVGLLYGNPIQFLSQELFVPGMLSAGTSAIVAVAFSFDGWLIAPTVCHEMKNAKRNLPLALTLAPISILVVYLLYFIGMTSLIGVEEILRLGDAHIYEIGYMLFGDMGAKIILVFVVISVLGTINGLYLALARVPYALAIRQEIPFSKQIAALHPKLDMPLVSCAIATAISFVWLLIHYASVNIPTLNKLDISSLPIVLTYFFHGFLYISIIRQTRKTPLASKLYGYVFPSLALLGAAFVLYGGFSDPLFAMYLIICLIIVFAGLLIQKKPSIMNTDKEEM